MDNQQSALVEVLRQAVEQHQGGQLNDARRGYLRFLRAFPDNAQALHLLGSLEAQAGKLNSAEQSLRKAAVAPNAQAGYSNTLATVLKQKGETGEALQWFGHAIQIDPGFGPAWHNRGRLLSALGRSGEAIENLERAAELMPGNARVHNDLGTVFETLGRHQQAMASFEHSVRADPAYAYAHNNLGAVHLACGRFSQAARCFENAIACDETIASAHDNLGLVLAEQGKLSDALASHVRAASYAPDRAAPLAHQGAVLTALGQLDEAESCFQSALALEPGCAPALAGLAELHEWRGDYQAGLELVEAAANAAQPHPDITLACARLLRRVYRVPEAIDLLTPLVGEVERLGNARARYAHFTMAQLLDDDGRYAEAFAHYEKGNRHRLASFDAVAWMKHVDQLIEMFSAADLAVLPHAPDEKGELVFIVGMPRSGTSLVEQILSRHPQVLAGGERAQLGQLAHGLGERIGTHDHYPLCVGALNTAILEGMAAEYRADLLPLPDGVDVVTDKMPLNFIHIGLIQLLFPHARVVHCTRDAVDTCLSCFFQDFPDPALSFSSSLRDTACFYRGYRRLMEHWQALPGVDLLEVRYESLVEDPQSVAGQLLEFLSLPWDDVCLRFYESGRNLHTASHAQVRRPIYTDAVGRRHHYRDFVGDLRVQTERR